MSKNNPINWELIFDAINPCSNPNEVISYILDRAIININIKPSFENSTIASVNLFLIDFDDFIIFNFLNY